MKIHALMLLIVGFINHPIAAQKTIADLAVGLSSYHIPIRKYKLNGLQPMYLAGIYQAMGPKHKINIGVQVGFHKNKFQGNALQVQGLIGFLSDVSKHVQLGVSTGIGYQMSFYPSGSLVKRDEMGWQKGKKFKGVLTAPLQLSIGYKNVQTADLGIQPYLAYRLQGHLRYSQDLNPLPKSSFMVGVKVNKL